MKLNMLAGLCVVGTLIALALVAWLVISFFDIVFYVTCAVLIALALSLLWLGFRVLLAESL